MGAATSLLLSVDSLRGMARGAWPGFEFPRRLMVTVVEQNVIAVIGETVLAPGFVWLDRGQGLATYTGAVPDSLRGLNVTGVWNGERYARTLVPYIFADSLMMQFLLHEAFHTYQLGKRLLQRGVFAGSGSEVFPRRNVDAVAALVLEADLLAQALGVTGEPRRNLLRRAMAAAELRCELAGRQTCMEVRELERLEGSADYVAYEMMILANKRTVAADRHELQTRLRQPDARSLKRDFFYPLARAWYVLIAEEGLRDWQAKAETATIVSLAYQAGVTRGSDARADEGWVNARRRARALTTSPQ